MIRTESAALWTTSGRKPPNTCFMAERKSEKGDLPTGWTRVGLQIPDLLADDLSRARERLPGQLSKLVGTAAISVFVSLPEDVQLMLYRWAHANELEPHHSAPQEALAVLLEMMRRHVGEVDDARPLHRGETQVVENAAKMIGDRSPSEEMKKAVKAFKLRDYDQEDRDREETRKMIAAGMDYLEEKQRLEEQAKQRPSILDLDDLDRGTDRKRKAPSRDIDVIGPVRRKPMAVTDVNGPSASDAAKSLVDHLKQPPLPNASTHKVTKIVGPEPKRGKGAA